MWNLFFAAIAVSIPFARAHIALYDPSMWGFNVTMQDFPYDNRPMAPLQQYTFEQWWFHGHLRYPPNPGNFFDLPAGSGVTSQLACNKGATKWFASSEGTTDIRQGDYPCPGYPTSQFHGIDDLKGCALSIAYTSDVDSIKPEDLVIFSVNHQCVWSVDTVFQVPQDMPPCPDGGCICGWHWIHSVDSGSAQMYMNGFRCQVTGSTSNYPLLKPEVPKRCTGNLAECNQGAQQPLYWFQAEGNNMFNDQYDPPYYLDEWGFTDGAQNNIFDKGGNILTPNSSPSSSSSSTYSSSSTPVNTPASTPANNQPAPSPAPSPSPTLSITSNGSSPPQEGDPPSSSSPSVPPPSYSPPANNNPLAPAPSPANGNTNTSNPPDSGGDGTEMDSGNPQPPSSSPLCKPRNAKKRQVVASRHFKHRRHFPREHHH